MRIAVVGAGIAGLTAAVALGRRGFAVEVMERAESLKEVGAGIQLSPNAMAVLERLGVAAHLDGAVLPAALEVRVADGGRLLARIPFGETARRRYAAPYCLVHRADLQAALVAAAGQDSHIRLRLGCEVDRISSLPDGVDISAAGLSLTADILVAADGVHSRLRTGHFRHPGAEPLDRHALRAILRAENVPAWVRRDVVGLWLAPGAHLVHYPLRAGKQLNLVVIAEGEPSGLPPLHCFGSPLRSLVEAVPEWASWPLHAVDARRIWTRERVVLIGDAAHAMAPSAAQGGAMAIEDAWVLGQSLAALPERPKAALQAYERARRPRVERVVDAARLNLRVYNLAGFPAALRNLALSRLPPRLHLRRLDWLFGWHPAEKP